MEGFGVSDISYVTPVDSGSYVMPLGTAWGPEPGGRYWGPGSRDSSCKASLGRGMLDDSSRCQYFSIVKFYCVESSE